MNEPTIDEMLAYLEDTAPRVEDGPDDWIREFNAICAILEQHRELPVGQIECRIIRSFVERVEKRARVFNSDVAFAIWGALQDELAAMEKESNNDRASLPDVQ